MTTGFSKPLGRVMNLVEAMGLDVTYAYDDLVFVEHNAFLLQMDAVQDQVLVHFNQSSEPEARKTILLRLKQLGKENQLRMVEKGIYTLEEDEDNAIKITFLP